MSSFEESVPAIELKIPPDFEQSVGKNHIYNYVLLWGENLLLFPMCASVLVFTAQGKFTQGLDAIYGTFPGWFVWRTRDKLYFKDNDDEIAWIDKDLQTGKAPLKTQVFDFCVDYSSEVITILSNDSREISNQYAKKHFPEKTTVDSIRQLHTQEILVSAVVEVEENSETVPRQLNFFILPIKTLEIASHLTIEEERNSPRHIRLMGGGRDLQFILCDTDHSVILIAKRQSRLYKVLNEKLSQQCMLVSHLHDDTWVVCGENTDLTTIRIILPFTLKLFH